MKNVRLLIADDDEQILRFLSNVLSDDFCIVGTVSNGNALIAAAVALHPHIILTDIDMPDMNGLDAIRQLEGVMPDSKVIVLTGHEEPEFAEAALAAGASAFLIKNGVPDLCDRIRAIIRDFLTAHPKQFTEQARAYGNDHASIERGVA
jgi:DNA-binding NarL/FixJ family response regulator